MSEQSGHADVRRIPSPRNGDLPGAYAPPAPSVTVVVPTLLRRASLAAAVRSVRAQDYPGEVVVVVVVDREESGCGGYERAWLAGADHVLFTGGGAQGGRARNMGVAVAATDLVAFLDDDDLWRPGKLSTQVPLLLAEEQGRPVVVASRVVEVRSDNDVPSRPVPSTPIARGQRVDDYLFRGRQPSMGRPSLHTSTLLMRRSTAERVPWTVGLSRHQDWDWLLRAEREVGAVVVQAEQVTVDYYLGSVGSISAGADWRSSLDWSTSWREESAAQTYADFVCAQPLRYAVQARSWQGVRSSLRRIASSRRVPSPGPLVYASGAVLSRRTIQKVVHGLDRGVLGKPSSRGEGVLAQLPSQRRPESRTPVVEGQQHPVTTSV